MRLDALYYAHPLSGAVMPVTTDLLAETYLAPKVAEWDLGTVLGDAQAPWAGSLAVDPDSVALAVGQALRAVMAAVPGMAIEGFHPESLPDSRARHHLLALKSVWLGLGALPPDLAVLHHVLNSTAEDALAALPLVTLETDPFATAAEDALQAQLLAHHGPAPEPALHAFAARRPPGATTGSLAHVQQGLLEGRQRVARDGSLAFFRLRDSLQEARFAAALARRMLEDGRAGSLSDIAVLVPEDPLRLSHLAEAFDAQGVPLSGLPEVPAPRDIAGEVASLAVQALRPPAPAMALASFATLPVMPWSQATGAALARDLMRGRYAPRMAENLTGQGRVLWQVLQGGATTAKQLGFKMGVIAESLQSAMPGEVTAIRASLNQLRAALGEGAPDWAELARLARPDGALTPPPRRLLEGVSVLSAAELPWRGARHLIVTGFAAGEYPRAGATSPFFLDSERAMIRTHLGLSLPGRGTAVARGLALFRRQIGVASDSVTFLAPRLDGQGKAFALPLTFSLIAGALQGGEQGLMQDISALPVQAWPVSHSAAVQRPPPPELPAAVTLGRDLLRLHEDEAGRVLAQSPSRLETLTVSPLAWALGEMDAVDVPWVPEALTILLKGTLAHHVLEHAFPVGPNLPDAAQLDAEVARHFADGIARNAPFLAAAQWQLERETLLREVLRAARTWLGILTDEGAEVLANEVRLEGEAHGTFIKGRADAVVRLGDGQLVIVDHKKSSATARRERMQAGWDLQIALYRAMLLRPIRREGDGLDPVLGRTPAMAYHTLNDGSVLQNGLTPRNRGSSRVEEVEGDISGQAVQLMQQRLAEVASGHLHLNGIADEAFFQKQAHLTPYAFDASPLVRRFMVAGGSLGALTNGDDDEGEAA
jgi:RecB family exonuclease